MTDEAEPEDPEEPMDPPETSEPTEAAEPRPAAGRPGRRWWLVGAAVVAVGLAWWARQLLGDSDGGRTASQAASGFFEAQRTGDCDRLVDLLTEDSWSQGGEWSEREFLDRCETALVGYRPAVSELEVKIVDEDEVSSPDGDRALVTSGLFGSDDGPTGRLVRDGGEWRVEADPELFAVGRSVDDALRGYVDAYNAGDCDAMRSFLAETTWSLDGSLSEDEFAERCRAVVDAAAGRRPLVVRGIEARRLRDGGDRRRADLVLERRGDQSILDQDPAVAVFDRDGLTWGFAGLADASGEAAAEGPSGPEPVPVFDWLDLQDRLVDEVRRPDELCTSYDDHSVGHPAGDRPARSILREFPGCTAGVTVALFRFGDDESARAAAATMVWTLLADLPPTAEELADVDPDADPADLERYAAGYRPNVEAAVPGLPDARGVQTFCSVDGCDGGQVFGVRDGVLVRVDLSYGDPDLAEAAAILQAQMDRL